MRESNFEVLVLRTVDNGQFDEDVVDDISYTVAEPGCEYYVKVIAHRNEDGSWPFPYIRIGLYIDGFDVQYWCEAICVFFFDRRHSKFSCSSGSAWISWIHQLQQLITCQRRFGDLKRTTLTCDHSCLPRRVFWTKARAATVLLGPSHWASLRSSSTRCRLATAH